MLIFLIPGYLYGVGDLLGRIFNLKRDFGTSLALSLVFWSVLGWFSFGHFGEIVLALSALGTLWVMYRIFKFFVIKRYKSPIYVRNIAIYPVIFTLLAVILRYALVFPFLYPYRRDFIMHSYTTASILWHNGYGSTYYPFSVEGLGGFNLGFHYVAAGFSIITGISAMDATVLTVFVMWGLLFWAVYVWVKDPWVALIALFSFLYPMSFLRWGGFPTVGAMAFGLLALRKGVREALPHWMGALSIHFIPSLVPFLVFLVERRHKWRKFWPYLLLLLLTPQYLLILKYGGSLSPREMAMVDAFVVLTFKKSLVVFAFLSLLAFLGYRYVGKSTPVWGVLLSLIAGLMSFAFAKMHLPLSAPKSFYLSRMIVLVLPPAAFGVAFLWRRFRYLILPLPLAVSTVVFLLHASASLNRNDWDLLKELPHDDDRWYLVSYGSVAAYLPALGIPAWKSHYIISQLDEFESIARDRGFGYVVCDTQDPAGPNDYYMELCKSGNEHPDVIGVMGRSQNLTIYRLK
ncbi:MAG: hypothetical protein GXO39_04660 [Thermotogae bacterium]|nr:hypothetical protein [Thermotogota bacterium]